MMAKDSKTGIKRLLNPGKLKILLDKALDSFGDRYRAIAVMKNRRILAAAGQIPSESPSDTLQPVVFPLQVNGETVEELVFYPANAALNTCDNSPGELLTFVIQEMIDREYARRSVTAETLEQYREISLLHRASMELNQTLQLSEVSKALLKECEKGASHAEMGMVFSCHASTNRFNLIDHFGPVETYGLVDIIKSAIFQEIASSTKGEIINDLAHDARWQNEISGLKSLLCFPLKSPGHWSGALILSSTRTSFNAADLKRISTIASVAATAMANAHHFEEVRQMQDALTQVLASAIDSRDPCTSGHSRRVARYAVKLAKAINQDHLYLPEMHFNKDEIRELYYAGLLHDVGKIGIKEDVLTKSAKLSAGQMGIIQMRLALWGALTGMNWNTHYEKLCAISKSNWLSKEDAALIRSLSGELVRINDQTMPLLTEEEQQQLMIQRGNLMPKEWDEIRRHPSESHRIMANVPFPDELKHLTTIIRQHHEKMDGSGYPDGINRDKILPHSRLIAITDIYDALTANDRPYKKSLSISKAVSILKEEACAGKLDRDMVSVFCQDIDFIVN